MKLRSGIMNSTSPPRGLAGPPSHFPQFFKNKIMDFYVEDFQPTKKMDTKIYFNVILPFFISVLLLICTSFDYFPF